MSRKILDTADGEVGTEFTPDGYRSGGTVRTGIVHAQLSTGDVVEIQGKLDASQTYRALATVTSTTEPPFQLTMTPHMRVERTTDGGVGESVVYLEELGP